VTLVLYGALAGEFFPNLERRQRKYFKVVALGQLLGCAPFGEFPCAWSITIKQPLLTAVAAKWTSVDT
jgi:hypothetical protein